MKVKKHIPRRILVTTAVSLILLFIALCTWYLGTYSPADSYAISNLQNTETVTVTSPREGITIFAPATGSPVAGLIFYPGGKVQDTAYAPLLHSMAEGGILCVLVKMPCNLAIFAPDRTESLMSLAPDVSCWWIGGHSLGGVVAANHAYRHQDLFDGMLLLASYTTKDFSQSSLKCLSIYGTNDNVLNRESYLKYHGHLPASLTETILEGGNHAQFGSYGIQKGDGNPSMEAEEQLRATCDAFRSLLLR